MNTPHGHNVLVVEDNPANQQVARIVLEHLGYMVDIADSGEQAVEMVDANQYAAVLMYVQSAGSDGYEATRQIRLRHPHRQLPVIAFTAHALESDRRRCFDAGMSDFLAKTAPVADLAEMLNRWIHQT